MTYAVKLSQFEGPLDLLLELIVTEKLDISEVSLARVTDGYLRHLELQSELPAEEMADFLLVASKLLLIKSRTLLPFLDADDGEAVDDLESQLRIYKEYLDASKVIAEIIARRRFSFVHDKLPAVEIGFSPPPAFTADRMADFFRATIRRLEPVVRVPKAVIEKTVSIHDKIRQLQALIAKTASLSFRTYIAGAGSRTEIVISFLALLELVKQRSVAVRQRRQFDDITVERSGAFSI